jgi:hypothetical protein
VEEVVGDLTQRPFVVNVYPNSWTNDIRWSAESKHPLGELDLSGSEISRFAGEWPPKPVISGLLRP